MSNQTTAVSLATASTVGGVGAWFADNMLTIVGIACALGTFGINWIYQHRTYLLEVKKSNIKAEVENVKVPRVGVYRRFSAALRRNPMPSKPRVKFHKSRSVTDATSNSSEQGCDE